MYYLTGSIKRIYESFIMRNKENDSIMIFNNINAHCITNDTTYIKNPINSFESTWRSGAWMNDPISLSRITEYKNFIGIEDYPEEKVYVHNTEYPKINFVVNGEFQVSCPLSRILAYEKRILEKGDIIKIVKHTFLKKNKNVYLPAFILSNLIIHKILNFLK